MTEFDLKNKIQEVRSYIASNWPGIEERKHLYQQLVKLESLLKEIQNAQKEQTKD